MINSVEEYYKLLELQKKYEDGIIDEDMMTIDEIDKLIMLYKSQIGKIEKNLVRILDNKNGDNNE